MAAKNSTKNETQRLIFVDVMRFLAIFLMFADHAFKLFYDFTIVDDYFSYTARIILLITTFSAPLFLFLVGASALLSYNNKKTNQMSWLRDKFKRGIFYILMSFLLFFYQEKFTHLPYTSGILQLIGSSLILISLLLVFVKKQHTIILFLLTITSLLTDSYLRSINLVLPIISKDNFPIFPFITYVFAGGFLASMFLKSKYKNKFIFRAWLISLLSITFFVYVSNYNPLKISATYSVINNYIIPSPLMVIYYLSLLAFIFSALAKLEKNLRQNVLILQASLIGKEALNVYVLHILLGWGVSKYMLEGQKFDYWAPITMTTIFTILGLLWTKARQKGYFQFMP